jgi:hypothetical protein
MLDAINRPEQRHGHGNREYGSSQVIDKSRKLHMYLQITLKVFFALKNFGFSRITLKVLFTLKNLGSAPLDVVIPAAEQAADVIDFVYARHTPTVFPVPHSLFFYAKRLCDIILGHIFVVSRRFQGNSHIRFTSSVTLKAFLLALYYTSGI